LSIESIYRRYDVVVSRDLAAALRMERYLEGVKCDRTGTPAGTPARESEQQEDQACLRSGSNLLN
jgi:hypothetical protein